VAHAVCGIEKGVNIVIESVEGITELVEATNVIDGFNPFDEDAQYLFKREGRVVRQITRFS
jgi:hypothetical protein